jgi:hypothetical protein
MDFVTPPVTPKPLLRGCADSLRFTVLFALAASAALGQTGGGATLVGTVTDTSGAVVAGAKVSVMNTGTSIVTESTTTPDGGYHVPYLAAGSYRITLNAPGFKQFVRDGITLRPNDIPRIDIVLEVGAVSDSVVVSGEAPLLNTENVASGFTLSSEVLPAVPGLMKRSVYLLQYMPGIVGIVGQGGFHIAGQAQNASNWTLDGISAKSPYTGTVNQVDGVLQPSLDAIEEFKVQVTGNSAENGHAAGGVVRAVYKSGTNDFHGSFEQRYLNGKWTHREYLTQFPVNDPWNYTVRDFVGSGPVIIPGLYNGRNKTFFLVDYVQNHENSAIPVRTAVPTKEMLAGDFSFPQVAGGGLPIYNPFSTRFVNGTWVRDPFPGNQIPRSLFDPVAVKFLEMDIWNEPNLPGIPTRTGFNENLLFNTQRILQRDRWDAKVDHQLSANHKIFFRYSQNRHRGSIGSALKRPELAGVDRINPVDQINGLINDNYILSPVMFNEFRLGFMRRRNSTPPRFGEGENWAEQLGIPGVGPESFPYFNIGFGTGALNRTDEIGMDFTLQNNLTRLVGRHSMKMGVELIKTTYNRMSASLPSGQYNFLGGTDLPFTPNTGQTFASFLLGTVTSATFTKPLATFLPIQWSNDWYFQDDWKITPRVTLNLGVRWSYSSPFRTKWDQQSQFDPNVIDPVTGRLGAITHPTGPIGKRDLNNFQPRLGLAWNFREKWVFRSSFDILTMDEAGAGGFDEYTGTFNIVQPVGDPNVMFRLSEGPGPTSFRVLDNGTVPYTGAAFNERNATWRDPNLRRPYVMNWSSGFQRELGQTFVLDMIYQGTAGIGLTRSWNINEIPLDIALGNDRALQDRVFVAQQNFRYYPHFGQINFLSNFNHNTWHSGNIKLDKRFSRGLIFNVSYNYSKSLSNAAEISYYDRTGKARTSYDYRHQFGAYVSYELPVGKGKRWLNQGGLVNAIVGGWTLAMTENAVSGQPISITHSGSPNRYLTPTTRVNALVPIEEARTKDWEIGNRFPTNAQNPYLDINAFAYPDAYTTGSLGANVVQAPAILWNQAYASKSWMIRERGKVTLRLDGHNLPWKRPNMGAPNTSFNLNNPRVFGTFNSTVGDFSNFGSARANVQGAVRVEF